MSDLNTSNPHMSEPSQPVPVAAQKSFWRRGRNLFLVSALVIGAGLTGAVVTGSVYAQGMGPGFGFHGMGDHGFGRGGFRQLDPAQIDARADRMVRHLAVELDATNDQTEKLRNIVKGALKDLMPLRTQLRDGREKARALLDQPNLTRNDIEAFRTQQLALFDQASKRVTQALGDAAEVLNADQRKKLGQIIDRRREAGHRWWHRGGAGRDRG